MIELKGLLSCCQGSAEVQQCFVCGPADLPGQEEEEEASPSNGEELLLGFYAPYLPDQGLSDCGPVSGVAPVGPE